MNSEDFFDQAEDMVEVDVTELVTTARRAVDLQMRIEALSLEMDELKSELSKLKTVTLPAMLDEANQADFTDKDTGWRIASEHAVNSKLPQDPRRRAEIFEKLEPLGVGEIEQTEFTLKFPKGDNRPAMIAEYLAENEVPFDRKTGAHSSTFKKWLKEQIEKGKGPELTEAGIWHGRHAKLVPPKG